MNGYKTCLKEIPNPIKIDIDDVVKNNHINGFLEHSEYAISFSQKGRYVLENNGRAIFFFFAEPYVLGLKDSQILMENVSTMQKLSIIISLRKL